MKNIKVLLLLLCLYLPLNAQTKFFTTDNGLSSSLVNMVYQDRNGMIWIATEDGLNRYDGSKITVYKHDPIDKHSLCHNFVNSLFEDKEGRLYVGTYNGIQIYDPERDRFSDNAFWTDNKPFRSNGAAFVQLKSGEIWALGNTPCRVTIENGDPIVSKITAPIPEGNIEEVVEDYNGDIWMICGEKICKLTPKGKVIHYMENEQKAGFTTLRKDFDGDIYAGSLTKGLFKYDKAKKGFIQIKYKNDSELPIMAIYCDPDGKIYVGTDGKGMKSVNKNRMNMIDYSIDINGVNPNRLKVHTILKDKDGNYWIGIFQKGVIMIPASRNNFHYYGYKSALNNFIGSNCITAIHKDYKGNLWVGTDNDGLYGLYADGTNLHYSSLEDNSGVPGTIMTLYADSDNTLWIGSYNKGMGTFNRAHGKFKEIPIISPKNELVERVYGFAEDREKRLWIATMGYGIYCYDLKKQQLKTNEDIRRMAQSDWLTCLHYSKATNKLYIGSYDGIGCTDLDTDNFHTTWALKRQIILAIYEDKKGNLWLGTSDGLVNWDLERNMFITYTTAHGLPSNAIYGIQGDKQESLWISTNNGLCQFSVKNQEVTNYYVTDGLQGNEFTKAASHQDEYGDIYFGGINGITYFSPKEIISPNKKWAVRITDFYIHNHPVRKGDLSDGEEIVDCAIYDAKEFKLGPKDNSFIIELATTELNAPERIIYSYSIDDREWIELPRGINYISFNDRAPGSYKVKIKATDNKIDSDITEVKVIIRHPWYRTWWAILCYLLIIGAGINLFLFLRKRKLNKKEEVQDTEE